MSAPRRGDTAGPQGGDDEAPIPEWDRRGAGSPHVETRGGEDSGQGDLEGGTDLPRTTGGSEQAALRQIVQEVLEWIRQGTIPLPPVEVTQAEIDDRDSWSHYRCHRIRRFGIAGGTRQT